MNKKTLLIILVIAAAVLLYFFWPKTPADTDVSEVDIAEWDTYTNEEFNFSIKHPTNWLVSEDLSGDNPIISIYKPDINTHQAPPFDITANTTHISIYPLGATGEQIGQVAESNAQFSLPTSERFSYVLRDATRFAHLARPAEPPASWSAEGFIWARTYVEDYKVSCAGSEAGTEIPADQCDLERSESIIQSGQINTNDQAIQLLMLNNFHLLRN